MAYPHISVLLKEFLSIFEGRKVSTFLDGTVGMGGHSEALLQAHPEISQLFGIDQDPEALGLASERLKPWKAKIQLIRSNFAQFTDFSPPKFDGILVDLGVSSLQLDKPEKGFSFLRDGPLDMRMNPAERLTAEEIINTWAERDLGVLFRDYGEEKKWRKAAYAVVKARQTSPIQTTLQLVDILDPVLRDRSKFGGIHPLTLVFQALRIAVNHELAVLEEFLPKALNALNPGGRLVVISFHSLEDRIVKNFFRQEASDKHSTSGIGGMFLDKKPQVLILTKKPIQPSDEEMVSQPRSRSAKMRAIEKLG